MMTDAETLARYFHETYERLAPVYGYTTRQATAVPWEQVPERNKRLMIAVSEEVLALLRRSAGTPQTPAPPVA
jgi:hypothetical protein